MNGGSTKIKEVNHIILIDGVFFRFYSNYEVILKLKGHEIIRKWSENALLMISSYYSIFPGFWHQSYCFYILPKANIKYMEKYFNNWK